MRSNKHRLQLVLSGGGTVLLQGDTSWNAPGGATAYIDSSTGESLIIFHAQDLAKAGTPFQWVKGLNWANGWPVISDLQPAAAPI